MAKLKILQDADPISFAWTTEDAPVMDAGFETVPVAVPVSVACEVLLCPVIAITADDALL